MNSEPRIPQSKIKILLVEDHVATLTALARLLRLEGYIVYTADGYQAALDVVKTERIDLVVSDIDLWDGDGRHLLRELQKLQNLKGIAVTGFTLPSEVEEYREAGFAAVVPKPLEPSQITSAISQLTSPQIL